MIRYIKENNEQVKEIPLECIKGATLLSKEEYEQYRDNIPQINNYWWLRSASDDSKHAYYIRIDGKVSDLFTVNETDYGIRPIFILNLKSSNFKIGDQFKLGEYTFTIISNNLAICNDIIKKGCFREDWMAKDANIYEKSDVKKIIDEWFDNCYVNKKLGLKSDEEIWEEDNWGF